MQTELKQRLATHLHTTRVLRIYRVADLDETHIGQRIERLGTRGDGIVAGIYAGRDRVPGGWRVWLEGADGWRQAVVCSGSNEAKLAAA